MLEHKQVCHVLQAVFRDATSMIKTRVGTGDTPLAWTIDRLPRHVWEDSLRLGSYKRRKQEGLTLRRPGQPLTHWEDPLLGNPVRRRGGSREI